MDDGPTALSLRIATFNLENFGEPSSSTTLEERVRLLKPQLVRLRADIVCLQEVDSQHRGEGKKKRALSALDALLADTPYAGMHRLATLSRSHDSPRDKHNLVVLSRFPFVETRQIFHDLVEPPRYLPAACSAIAGAVSVAIEWERPLLHAVFQLPGGARLDVINVHLRAPRAAFVAGGKASARSWKSMAGWAEGFFLAAVKSAGQALEARLLIDSLFDRDPGSLIVVGGDFNADLHETAVRTIRGDEEDAGNPHLAFRTLVPVDRSLADSRRFSVVHHGRPQMLDHLLVSRAMLAWLRGVEVHNEALGDELVTPQSVVGSAESFHAPLVAEFHIGAVASP